MYLQNLERNKANIFTLMNEIPLGVNTGKGMTPISEKYVITIPYKNFSGSWGVIGESGSGKSVLVKRIYSYLLGYYQSVYNGFRPGIIFDMQSEDHWRSKMPNSIAFNLFWEQGEEPIGLKRLDTYAPLFIRDECHPFDQIFGFDIKDFNTTDFVSLGMGAAAANQLTHILKSVDSIPDLEKFFNDLVDYPINVSEISKLKKREDYTIPVPLNPINYSSKNSMTNNISLAINDNVFVVQDKPFFKQSFIEEMRKRRIVVVNFHQEERYYSLYGGKILRDIYMARRKSFRDGDNSFPPPIVIVEEAHKLAPAGQTTVNSSTLYLLDILKMGRRYGFFTILITQEASSLNEGIRSSNRQWIIGKISARDLAFFSNIFSSDVIEVIRNLEKKKHEFIVIDENGFDTFRAFNSPLEIQREDAFLGGAAKSNIY